MITRKSISAYLVATLLYLFSSIASAGLTAEDYGVLPPIRSVKISPDAKHYAFIGRVDKQESLFVVNFASRKVVASLKIGEHKVRDIYFSDNKYIILTTFPFIKSMPAQSMSHFSGLYALDIETSKVIHLKSHFKENLSHVARPRDLGKIVGFSSEKRIVYMYSRGRFRSLQGRDKYDSIFDATFNLYRVSLESRSRKVHRRGNLDTIDWFVGKDGKVLARADFVNKSGLYKVYSYSSGRAKQVYQRKVLKLERIMEAVSKDESGLIFRHGNSVFNLSLNDGSVAVVDYARDEAVQYLKTDLNRKLVAIGYGGLLPYEVLVNPELDSIFSRIQASQPNTAVKFMGSDASGKKLLVHFSGNKSSGDYVLFDSQSEKMVSLGREYERINTADIGQIMPITYDAKDGVKIPSIITWPSSVAKGTKKNLPLIVMPRSNPGDYDYMKFDWWAQYLARKGYLVLQPNFRGPSGVGETHQGLGVGEWAKVMRTDISDGVLELIKAGYADPKRVCIMGASYGGYAALAGGAFSPELYRCVVSVAGVADASSIPTGSIASTDLDGWPSRYLSAGNNISKVQRNILKDISPLTFVENFTAPVLLVHTQGDKVVPLNQSKAMYKKLLNAGKTVELVILDGEDHQLLKNETRVNMLNAIDLFLEKYNPS